MNANRPYITKQERMRRSPHAQQLHETALARACAMAAMRKQGLTNVEIGRLFGVSAEAVYHALKRQGFIK